DSKIDAGHLRRLLDTEHRQYSWRNIAQRSSRSQPLLLLPVNENEWNWIGRVRSVRPARLRIDEHLRIAVICRDDEPRTRTLGGFEDSRQRLVDSLHCFDR